MGSIELKSAVFLHGHSAQVGTTHRGTRRVPLYRYPLWKQRVLIEKMMILGAFGHGFGKTFRFQHTHAMLWRWAALVDTQCFAKKYYCHLGEKVVVQSGTCPKHQIFRLVSSLSFFYKSPHNRNPCVKDTVWKYHSICPTLLPKPRAFVLIASCVLQAVQCQQEVTLAEQWKMVKNVCTCHIFSKEPFATFEASQQWFAECPVVLAQEILSTPSAEAFFVHWQETLSTTSKILGCFRWRLSEKGKKQIEDTGSSLRNNTRHMEGFGNSGSWFFRWSVLQLRLPRCLWTAKIIGCIISSASCCALACEHPHFARHSVCSVALGLVVTSAAQISFLLFHTVHHLVLLGDLMNFRISFLSRVCWCEVMPPEFRDIQLASSAKSGQHGENRFRLARLKDQSLDITGRCIIDA